MRRLMCACVMILANRSVAADVKPGAFEEAVAALAKTGAAVRLSELAPPKVPDDRNAATALAGHLKALGEANNDEYRALDRLLQSPTLDDAGKRRIRAFLDKQTPVMNALREALARPQCRWPLDYSSENPLAMVTPHLEAIERAVRLLGFSARLHVEEGRGDEAIAECATMLRLSRGVEEEPLLVSLVMASSFEESAMQRLRLTLDSTEPSEKALREALAAVGDPEDRNPVMRALRGERCNLIATFRNLSAPKGDGLERELGKDKAGAIRKAAAAELNVTGPKVLALLDRVLANATKPHHIAKIEWPAVDKEFDAFADDGKPIGNLAAVYGRVLTRIPSLHNRTLAVRHLARIGIALRLHRLKHSGLPDDLSGLQPASGVDPFSGKAFVYKKSGDGFLLYSVDENGRDDGGKTRDDDARNYDCVWRIRR